MHSFRRRTISGPQLALVAAASAAPAADIDAAVRSIGQKASTIGRESAEVRGLLDDTTLAAGRSAAAMAALAGQVKDVTAAPDAIRCIAAEGITNIALQTRLIAFNASVEAKRSGPARPAAASASRPMR